jgi:hypothetical protein
VLTKIAKVNNIIKLEKIVWNLFVTAGVDENAKTINTVMLIDTTYFTIIITRIINNHV